MFSLEVANPRCCRMIVTSFKPDSKENMMDQKPMQLARSPRWAQVLKITIASSPIDGIANWMGTYDRLGLLMLLRGDAPPVVFVGLLTP